MAGQAEFLRIISELATEIGEAELNPALEVRLNEKFPATGPEFSLLTALCAQGEIEGWLMAREAGGIKFGRAVKSGKDAGHFSVDVVRMKDIAGPHHIHTAGEIGAIMPLSGDPAFDGKPKGWYVYPLAPAIILRFWAERRTFSTSCPEGRSSSPANNPA
jgi:hypothetical protein